MLLQGYDYRLVNIFCLPNSTEWNAVVQLREDVTEVMPYLNAVLKRRTYSHEHRILDFMHKGHIITIEPKQIKITGLSGDEEAREVLGHLVDLINRTWEERDTIVPIHLSVRPVKPLEILALLPKSNCQACGEPTCFAFALRVVNEDLEIADCPELSMSEWARQAETLKNLMEGKRGPGANE